VIFQDRPCHPILIVQSLSKVLANFCNGMLSHDYFIVFIVGKYASDFTRLIEIVESLMLSGILNCVELKISGFQPASKSGRQTSSVNQLNQSVSQQASQLTSQLAIQSTCQSASQPTNPTIDRTTNQSIFFLLHCK